MCAMQPRRTFGGVLKIRVNARVAMAMTSTVVRIRRQLPSFTAPRVCYCCSGSDKWEPGRYNYSRPYPTQQICSTDQAEEQ